MKSNIALVMLHQKSMSYSYVVHQYLFYLYVIFVVHNYVVDYCLEWAFVLFGKKTFRPFRIKYCVNQGNSISYNCTTIFPMSIERDCRLYFTASKREVLIL